MSSTAQPNRPILEADVTKGFYYASAWFNLLGVILRNPEFFTGALAEHVLSLLDEKSLCASACVSKGWRQAIAHGMLWRKLIEKKVRADSLWRGLSEKRGWLVDV